MKSLPKISLWVLFGLSLLIGLLFYFGGNSGSIQSGGEAIEMPTYVNPLIYWAYFLIILAIAITIGFLVIQFILKLKDDSKAALKSLVALVGVALLIIVSFFLGSSEPIQITGYEGTDNSGFWAQFTDMCLFSMYALVTVAFLSIFAVGLFKQVKK
jgi:hypothetical protein